MVEMGTFQFSLQKTGSLKSPDLARSSSSLRSFRSPQSSTLSKSCSRNNENFSGSKLNSEKIVPEQNRAKTEVQIANYKLRKSTEKILLLETKLQHCSNENAKLKLKQKEDAKLWKGLDSKLSSTKMLCDQLTETLQHLASKVEEAEGSKQCMEEKLIERWKLFEELALHVNTLSSKLNTAVETIEKREHELKELLIEKEHINESYDAEVMRTNLLIVEKDNIEKHLQATIEEDNRAWENAQKQLKEVQKKLSLKENACGNLQIVQSKLVTEKAQLKTRIQEYEEQLSTSESQREMLKDEILSLSNKTIELEKISVVASNNMDRLLQEIDKSTELAELEKKLAQEKAQFEFDHLNAQFHDALSENASLKSQIQESNNQITELQNSLDLRKEEYAKKEIEAQSELHNVRHELDKNIEKNCQLEGIVANLQENIARLSRSLNEVQMDKEDLTSTILKLKAENQDALENLHVMIQQKEEEIETLQKKASDYNSTINLRDTEIYQLQQESINKAQLIVLAQESLKALEERNVEISAQVLAAERAVIETRGQCELQLEAKQAEITTHLEEISHRNAQEINDIRRNCEAAERAVIETRRQCELQLEAKQAELTTHLEEISHLNDQEINDIRRKCEAAERAVIETRRQCELQLEAKPAELTRHLKEISHRNDQEINDIRRKCEAEMMENVIREKEKEKLKADALLEKVKINTEETVAKLQEDASRCLKHVKVEHESYVKRLREENDKEKQLHQEQYTEERRKKQKQFERDLEEQRMKFVQDTEVKIKDLKNKHREEVEKLQEEQNIQQKKEEEKRASLELQINIMKKKLQEESQRKEVDLEVNLNKEFSASTQIGANYCKQGKQGSVMRLKTVNKNPSRMSLGPAANIRQKSEKAKADSLVSIPTHSKKITQHEYEIATSDGTKTITKRKRTRSTVMFGEASAEVNTSQKKINTRQRSTKQKKHLKASHPHASTIGDLFGGGSLDPYAEDPYAFD